MWSALKKAVNEERNKKEVLKKEKRIKAPLGKEKSGSFGTQVYVFGGYRLTDRVWRAIFRSSFHSGPRTSLPFIYK